MVNPSSLSLVCLSTLILFSPVVVAVAVQPDEPVAHAATSQAASPVAVSVNRTVATRADALHLPIKDKSFRGYLAGYVSVPVQPGCHRVVTLASYRADGWAAGQVSFRDEGSDFDCRQGYWQVFHHSGAGWEESIATTGVISCDKVRAHGVPQSALPDCYRGDGNVVKNPIS